MSKWAGVRYLRVALEQKGRGVIRLDLGSSNADGAIDGSPEVMPDKLSEWLAASSRSRDEDGMSLSGERSSHSSS